MKKEAMLYKKLDDNRVHCHLCSHHCKIADGELGFCGVRRNIAGTLYTLVFGEAIARNVDHIEKKPLYHFLPGTFSYSIATIGCNFHCGFCQNWQISQVSKHTESESVPSFPPEEVVEDAKHRECATIAYTYTEPTIFFEYAYETAKLAKEAGIQNIFVTNGYMSRKALDAVAPYLDAANVDLKAWREEYYAEVCEAHLKPVLDTIRNMKKAGIWVEVTTLVIPGENDSDRELEGIASFIADVGADIPWHISRFHPGYRFSDHQATPLATLEKAAKIGKSQGLQYVYLGNVPGDNNTYCPQCGEAVVERSPGSVRAVHLDGNACRSCGAEISGVWR